MIVKLAHLSKRLRLAVLLVSISYVLFAGGVATAAPVADDPNPGGGTYQNPACTEYVLTFPTWYRGITGADCQVQINELNDFIKIPLNIIEIMIQIAAYAATGFILWGGFKYMKSQGEASKIGESKSAILQAVIGLSIALTSVVIVRFIQSRII